MGLTHKSKHQAEKPSPGARMGSRQRLCGDRPQAEAPAGAHARVAEAEPRGARKAASLDKGTREDVQTPSQDGGTPGL